MSYLSLRTDEDLDELTHASTEMSSITNDRGDDWFEDSIVSTLSNSHEYNIGSRLSHRYLDLNSLHKDGRTRELAMIQDVFYQSGRQIVLLEGESGVGKTSLVHMLRDETVLPLKAYFVEGAFDQFSKQRAPYAAFSSALSDLCELVHQDANVDIVREELLEELGPNKNVLIRLIPSLSLILGIPDDITTNLGASSITQFQLALKAFLKVICKPRKVVLYLHGWQWSDEASQDLLRVTILQNICSENLMVVCSYHDESNFNFSLPTSPTRIRLENLDLSAVHSIITKILRREYSATSDLSQVIFKKSAGNPFHIREFLELLLKDSLLYFSTLRKGDPMWCWDLDRIVGETSISANVADIVHSKIHRLPLPIRNLLKIAACIGFSFDMGVLQTVVTSQFSENHEGVASIVSRFLAFAAQEGLVVGQKSGDVKFTHDRIHQSLLSMIGDERQYMHLKIGRSLYKSLPMEPEDGLVLLTTEQLNRGIDLSKDYKETLDLAWLNLRASKVAAGKSAFKVAMEYLMLGTSLLKRLNDPWTNHYSLSRQLFYEMAEVGVSCGKLEESRKVIEHVIIHSKDAKDRLLAYVTEVKIVGDSGNAVDAVQLATKYIRRGFKFPLKPSNRHVVVELAKTKRLFNAMDNEAFMNLPLIKSNDIIGSVMSLMGLIIYFAQLTNDKPAFSVACLRCVQFAMRHGLSDDAVYGIANYGKILSILNQRQEAFRIGCLCLEMMEKKLKSNKPMTISAVYCYLAPLRRHPREGIAPLITAYEDAMAAGQVMPALFAAGNSVWLPFILGSNLYDVHDQVEVVHRLAVNFGMKFTLTICLPTVQVIRNLLDMEGHDDPALMKGTAITEYALVPIRKTGFPEYLFSFHQLMLAVLMERWQLAEVAYDDIVHNKLVGNFVHAHIAHPLFQLFAGITLLARYKEDKKRKYLVAANKIIKSATALADEGMVIYKPIKALLLAEKTCMTGVRNAIIQSYLKAVTVAQEEGLTHFCGLTNERAAAYFWNTDAYLSQSYLIAAHQYYELYGSPVLKNKVEKKLEELRRIASASDSVHSRFSRKQEFGCP